jgi:WD40 repeat protein
MSEEKKEEPVAAAAAAAEEEKEQKTNEKKEATEEKDGEEKKEESSKLDGEEKKEEAAAAAEQPAVVEAVIDNSPKPLPPGVSPFFLADSAAQEYGMKNGKGIVDLVPEKWFATDSLMEKIKMQGKLCAWDPVEKELKQALAAGLTDVLVITDAKSIYGEMYLLYFSEDVIAIEKEKAAAAVLAAKAEEERLAKEEEDRAAAEYARKNAVYVDKPLLSRPWIGASENSGEETAEEVNSLYVQAERPLISISIGRPANWCGKPLHLGSRDHFESIDFRRQMIPEFNLNRMEQDCGVQAAPEKAEGSSQTSFFRPVNQSCQYTAIVDDESNNNNSTSTSTSTSTGTSTGTGTAANGKVEIKDSDSKIADFLRRVLPDIEESLQHNETVDIFRDALSGIGEDDSAVGSKMNSALKEIRNFTDLDSKNKSLACIDWHPTREGVIGVSVCKNLNFDERVKVSGQVDTAFIIVWEFAEWIHPMLALQSPHECFSFAFNPTQPNIVCAGLLSGQAAIWDMTDRMESIANKKKAKGQQQQDEDDEEAKAKQLPLQTTAISHIDTSHRRMVADCAWLAADAQVNVKGQILDAEHLDGKSYQFMTIAGDGQALIWDIRYEDISAGKYPHIYKPKASHLDKPNKDGTIPRPTWLPLFRMSVKRLEGVGELSLCKLLMNLSKSNDSISSIKKGEEGEKNAEPKKQIDTRSQLFCSSEEGDLVFVDWRARSHGARAADEKNSEPGAANGGGNDDDHSDTPEFVQWMSKDHNRPSVSLAQSPFFPDLIVTASDWTFHLWKLNSPSQGNSDLAPIFTSPDASTYITTAKWSPTRPATLFVGKSDGCIDVWDFSDSSYKPSTTLETTPSRITSMEFLTGKTANKKTQLLAVGDEQGSLHVFEMQRNLWRPLVKERTIMANFLAREIRRKEFGEKRLEIREGEAKDTMAALTAARENEQVKDGEQTLSKDELAQQEEEKLIDLEEKMYKELEKKCMVDLGMIEAED